MAEFPALPLFTDAYLADTRHLSTLQHGAYLLMLMTAWRSSDCSLPNDDVFLARICGMDKRTWLANKPTLLEFWYVGSSAKLFQKRLEDERKYVEQKRNKNSDAGKASALKRLNRGSTTVQPNVNQNSTPTPTPTYSEEDKSSSSPPTPKKENFVLPDWVNVEAWDGWVEMRKKMKAPLTDYAKRLAIGKLTELKSQGHDPTACIELAITKNWKSFYAPKEEKNYGSNRQSPHDKLQSAWQSVLEDVDKRQQNQLGQLSLSGTLALTRPEDSEELDSPY